MALGFFRNNQKFVLIIMAVLMVTFGVSSVITSTDCARRQGDYVVGHADGSKVMQKQMVASARDLQVLKDIYMQVHPAFISLVNNGSNDIVAFTLLLLEAKKAGIRVTSQEVADCLRTTAEKVGAEPAALYKAAAQQANADQKAVDLAVSNWLMVKKNFDIHRINTPPSELELRQFYRDCHEGINLRMLKLKAADFEPKAMPSQKDMLDLFNKYKGNYPGTYTDENPFGFGYIQPSRVKVQYLLIKHDVVERVVRPADAEVVKVFGDSYQSKGVELEKVREAIVASLMPKVTADRMDIVLDQAEQFATELGKGKSPNYNAYAEAVRSRMTGSADRLLQTPLTNLHLAGPLEDVIGQLGQEAKVTICYPWGKHGEAGITTIDISPKVSVNIDAEKITLGQALQKITDQVMGPSAASQPAGSLKLSQTPQLKWAACQGFDRTIFPFGNGELDMFPLDAQETIPLDGEGLSKDPVLGQASTVQEQPGQNLERTLLYYAMTAKPLISGDRKEVIGAMDVGEQGQRMYAASGNGFDRLSWRLSQASPQSEPKVGDLKTDPRLNQQIVKDWKIMMGFNVALAKAEQIQKVAAKDGLEAAAKSVNLQTTETGLFPRKFMYSPRENEARRLEWMGKSRAEAAFVSLQYPPADVTPAQVPGLELQLKLSNPPAAVVSYLRMVGTDLINKAFSLAPAKVEPPYLKDLRTAVAPVKPLQCVAVMQRAGFKPALSGDFDKAKAEYAHSIVQIENWRIQQHWFNFQAICMRTSYQPEKVSAE